MRNYWMLIWFIIGVTVGLLIPTSHAYSQSLCGERAVALKNLLKNYGEEPKHIALANDGRVLEVLVSPETGTWTIMLTDTTGRACGMAMGEAWEDVPGYGKGQGL